jgi:hypothetical protein
VDPALEEFDQVGMELQVLLGRVGRPEGVPGIEEDLDDMVVGIGFGERLLEPLHALLDWQVVLLVFGAVDHQHRNLCGGQVRVHASSGYEKNPSGTSLPRLDRWKRHRYEPNRAGADTPTARSR